MLTERPRNYSRTFVNGVVAVGILLMAGACSGGSANAPTVSGPPASTESARTVTLAAVGSSGVFGTATLSDAGGGQTQVVIKVEANLNRDMPTVVTAGSCAKFDETTLYELNDTRDGAATTIIPVALAALIQSPHEVHLVAGGEDFTAMACGDIK
jgi:ABC-type phosphate transport system substrate-binding protein